MDTHKADYRDLLLADAKLADGERQIEAQIALIARMEHAGDDAAAAKSVLLGLLDKQDRREDRRDSIAQMLGSPDFY